MMRLRLQVFENRCAHGGSAFYTLNQSPADYGVAVFVSEKGHVAVAVADEDIVWIEAERLIDALAKSTLSGYERSLCFPHLFNRTVDEIADGQLYMWGQVPCPHCGSFRRPFLGPKILLSLLMSLQSRSPIVDGNLLRFSKKKMRHARLWPHVRSNICLEPSPSKNQYAKCSRRRCQLRDLE
jgi:hypothetical protein